MFLFFLGIVPSIFVYKVEIIKNSIKKELISRLKLLVFNIVSVPILYLLFSKYWVSFFRMHKPLRMYTNPTYYIYSLAKFVKEKYFTKPMKFKHIGLDAKVEEKGKPKLVIFVLGEAARYDHFSLNGYSRDTNKNLENIKDLINSIYTVMLPKVQKEELKGCTYMVDALFILVGGKKIEILKYIINNLDKDHIFYGSYQDIMEAIGVSKPTVVNMFKQLIQAGVLEKIKNKVYKFKNTQFIKDAE